MKNIIKKIICSLCLGMIMTGCSGVTDYRIILNNDYYIAKTSANNAKIFKIEDKDITGRAPSIPVYNKENDEEYEKESVIKVGQDSTYIIAQKNMDRYYILDTKEESVLEFKSEYEFNLKKKELGISEDVSLESLGKYKKE
ncbi:DUF3997 domain-containing protein [Romboutsia timonensis]|uniref:DUF3997 domain-containing protein n=1 Tax=Romboutsia timonensis TaxID=1776391 RepID=UPI0008D9EDFA|nr:DUF3997 domain-containing protein [Romboutsia timonensis]